MRELRNAIERAVVLARAGRIRLDDLPERISGPPGVVFNPSSDSSNSDSMRVRIAEVEKSTVEMALMESGGNQSQAARHLGISRWALIRLMKKHGLKRPRTGP